MQNHPEIKLIDNRDNDHVTVFLQPGYFFRINGELKNVASFDNDEELIEALETMQDYTEVDLMNNLADKALYRDITQD